MFVIGLDVGGTKIEGILAKAAPSGSVPKVIRKVRLPTYPFSREKTMGNIVAAVAALNSYGKRRISGFRLGGIGLGTAGFLKGGHLEMAPNIPALKGIRLCDVLLRQLGLEGIRVPLKIENDGVCFAIAESLWGAARGFKSVIGVVVGTGIGGGLILDGRVCRGRDGGAGHIGHFTVDPSGPMCGCGQKGHFESWCSGKYITQRYLAAGGIIREPDPQKIFYSKEAVAMRIMGDTYEKFGIALASLLSTFNPEIIVMGGGVSSLPGEFYRRVKDAAKKRSYPAFYDDVLIVRNKLGGSAGVFGAAALVLEK